MSWRRFANLIRALPHDSALSRAIHGARVEWSTTDHLLAVVADILAVANWQRAPSSRRPKPIPRPGVAEAGRKRMGSSTRSAEEMRALLDQWTAGELERKPGQATEVR